MSFSAVVITVCKRNNKPNLFNVCNLKRWHKRCLATEGPFGDTKGSFAHAVLKNI